MLQTWSLKTRCDCRRIFKSKELAATELASMLLVTGVNVKAHITFTRRQERKRASSSLRIVKGKTVAVAAVAFKVRV